MLDYYLYRIGQFFALHIPLKLGYKLAIFFSDMRSLVAFRDRRYVRANLRVIFPSKSEKEIRALQINMFRNFAKYLVDFFRFEKIDKEYIEKNIRIENRHYLNEVFNKGKGVVLLTAHIGNWELGGAVISLLGYPIWAVALPHKYEKVNSFFNAQRQSKGVRVIHLNRAVKESLSIFKKNQAVALVGDRDFTEDGAVLPFFGKPTVFPKGAAAFSLRTGAPILPGFMLRNEDDTFTLRIEQPILFNPSGDGRKDTIEIIKIYLKIFEKYITKYPDQWFMFRRFWIE
ncbi:MAG: lysophospholipid acyltransferase family protein [Candidatus Omnitrophica bacterium]|nr:lysophospholipid acyltransferase family protein [Candidatus Omnitrophota bacterium]